ncbi:hypothetical protein FHX42_002843 [Saccharopolyspora lacisalsi]|uniref:PIN domain-containing protein n=1 Tax=Halosaccharopolyspora lacisalsi TaxID=1000566 RepID=A0A839DU32_9PSEU|nr:hypothetical protein [Halosaccharopolyspora lacisalsi]MBA8825492.1 hypothetical protein [Halosaccharopolyspora lacisalsi]
MNARFDLVLDVGVPIKVESLPNGAVIQRIPRTLETGRDIFLPAVAFAQVWRQDPRQYPMHKLRKTSRVVPFTEETAVSVGRLLRLSGTSDVVDAAVVVAAIEHDATVVTSDPADLSKLAGAVGFPLPLIEA